MEKIDILNARLEALEHEEINIDIEIAIQQAQMPTPPTEIENNKLKVRQDAKARIVKSKEVVTSLRDQELDRIQSQS